MAESEEELNSLLKMKEESDKADLKLSIQKTKIMASSPMTSLKMDGETMETVTDFIFLCSKIIGDSDCSHEIKTCLLLERKAMSNLDSILKSRNINSLAPSLLYGPTLTSIHDYWKDHSLTGQTFVGKVMSLLL